MRPWRLQPAVGVGVVQSSYGSAFIAAAVLVCSRSASAAATLHTYRGMLGVLVCTQRCLSILSVL